MSAEATHGAFLLLLLLILHWTAWRFLTLTDLNDFITPSQACIKPVEQTNKPEPQDPGAAATQIQVDSSGSYYEISANGASPAGQSGESTKQKLTTAEISLNDCLACSGCITSAESVLITMQSHTEVLNFLQNNPPLSSPSHKVPVISIAPQTLASFAASISSTSSQTISLLQILRRVRAFCTSVLGFEHVYDTTFARHLSLLEHAREFAERKEGKGEGKLPMLASACPGWVCYAEKTHAEMLPFISRTKSPQQVMGTLVKAWMGAKWGRRPDQIYHVTVMPCYDKKLEASRQDFYNDAGVKMDVDEPLPAAPVGPKWGDKEWTRKVEAAYWHALPTPPPTPPADGASPGSVFEYADRLAVRVLSEVTGAHGGKVGQWTESLDGEAEEKRRTLFRTQYRAVESEVVGLAVKW
ncbi:iron hydrogenase [Trametes sanguinea]|nr:iron hydrogenase [Trametes sanguinea]